MTNTAQTQQAEAVTKVTKKSQAFVIFADLVGQRKTGEFSTNKDFRTATVQKIATELGVSIASASTMYNAAKKEVEAAGELTLGRDPKKEKAPSTGKKGRPVGSKNKPKVVVANVVVVDDIAEQVAA